MQYWVSHVRAWAIGESGLKVYRCVWVGYEHDADADCWISEEALRRHWGVDRRKLAADADGKESNEIVAGI